MANREIEKKRVKMRRAYLKSPKRAYDPTVTMQFYQRRVHGETEFDRWLNMVFPGRKNGGSGPRNLAKNLADRLADDGIDVGRLLANVNFMSTKNYGLWLMFRDDGCSFFMERNRNIWRISCWYASRDRAKEVYNRIGTQGIRWIDWINVEENRLKFLMD